MKCEQNTIAPRIFIRSAVILQQFIATVLNVDRRYACLLACVCVCVFVCLLCVKECANRNKRLLWHFLFTLASPRTRYSVILATSTDWTRLASVFIVFLVLTNALCSSFSIMTSIFEIVICRTIFHHSQHIFAQMKQKIIHKICWTSLFN